MDSNPITDIALVLTVTVTLFLQGSSAELSETWSQIVELLKIIVPAALAYLASRMQANRAQRVAQDTIEARTREQLVKQQEGVFEEYRTISVQAREVVAESYRKAAEEAAARRIAEARVVTLEEELGKLRRQHEEAIEELEDLRLRLTRRVGRERTRKEPS